MWNSPRLLNAAAGFLSSVALLLFAFAALQLLMRMPQFPLRELTVNGRLEHTTRQEIERAAQGRIAGNFFAVDLAALRAGLERLPWVRRVELRRVWPDRIEVAIEEHIALARWNDAGLVNTHGERFPGQSDAALPAFSAPAGTEGEVTRSYRAFAALLGPLDLAVAQVVLTPRFAWQVQLGDGTRLLLGREALEDRIEARLARFVAAWPGLRRGVAGRRALVDLRYPNGFALSVRGAGTAPGALEPGS